MDMVKILAILVFAAALFTGVVVAYSGTDTKTEAYGEIIDDQQACPGDGNCNGECDGRSAVKCESKGKGCAHKVSGDGPRVGSCDGSEIAEGQGCPRKAAGTCPNPNRCKGSCGAN